jgi:hypothetical protein
MPEPHTFHAHKNAIRLISAHQAEGDGLAGRWRAVELSQLQQAVGQGCELVNTICGPPDAGLQLATSAQQASNFLSQPLMVVSGVRSSCEPCEMKASWCSTSSSCQTNSSLQALANTSTSFRLFAGRRRNRRVSTAAERLRPSSAQPGLQHGHPGPLAGIKPRQNAPAACALPAASSSTQSAELPAKRSRSRQSCPHQSTSRAKQHRSRFCRLVSRSSFWPLFSSPFPPLHPDSHHSPACLNEADELVW